ncbi:hypothetical protein ACVNP1_01345 [Staphylococcus aureus]
MIARHEILRTQYIVVDDEVRQRIVADVVADFEEVNTHLWMNKKLCANLWHLLIWKSQVKLE